MVARAMDNCGLKNLILVSPREKWPNQKFNNYIGISEKFIFDLLSHIKKISENIQNDQILQKLADLYLK